MSVKKIMKEMEPEEIVKSFVLPVKLTKKEREEARIELLEAIKKYREANAKRDYIKGNLLQLRSKLEDYVKGDLYEPGKKFGDILKVYLLLTAKKSNELAKEISIHETLLSQLLNNHREPNEDIMIRLEIHSNNHIPAHIWFMLVQKEKINQLKTNKALRKREKKFVVHKIKK